MRAWGNQRAHGQARWRGGHGHAPPALHAAEGAVRSAGHACAPAGAGALFAALGRLGCCLAAATGGAGVRSVRGAPPVSVAQPASMRPGIPATAGHTQPRLFAHAALRPRAHCHRHRPAHLWKRGLCDSGCERAAPAGACTLTWLRRGVRARRWRGPPGTLSTAPARGQRRLRRRGRGSPRSARSAGRPSAARCAAAARDRQRRPITCRGSIEPDWRDHCDRSPPSCEAAETHRQPPGRPA